MMEEWSRLGCGYIKHRNDGGEQYLGIGLVVGPGLQQVHDSD